MSKGNLRDEMPICAAFIDDLRAAFGKDYIDRIIRAGINGKRVFFASENGKAVGTPVPTGVRVGTDERGNRYLIDGPIPGEPVEAELTKYEHRRRREKLKGVR